MIDRPAFDAWAAKYRARLRAEGSDDAERRARMDRVNPKYVLRNHLAEIAIGKARGDDGERDFDEVARLLKCWSGRSTSSRSSRRTRPSRPTGRAALELSCSS